MGKLPLMLLAFATVIGFGCQNPDNNTPSPKPKPSAGPFSVVKDNKITIGALLPLSGNLSESGKRQQSLIDIAKADLQKTIKASGSRFEIDIVAVDTKTEPKTAVAEMKKMAEQGIHLIAGPSASAEVVRSLKIAQTNNILFISPQSTAPTLAKPNDGLCRFAPPDSHQGRVLANAIMKDMNRKCVVILSRQDLYGSDLARVVLQSVEDGGGAAKQIAYSTDTKDFRDKLVLVKSYIKDAASWCDKEGIAVQVVAFEEILAILSKAKELDDADDNKTLSKNVAWFGADSITQSPAFLSGTPEANTAASFFVTTNMQSTLFALAPSHEAKFEEFSKRVMTEKQFQPNTYEGNFYDAIQALGETAVALGSKEISFTDLLTAFLDKTKTLEGVTGLLALDESCDRASSAYDFFTLQKSGDTYSWVKTKKQVPE